MRSKRTVVARAGFLAALLTAFVTGPAGAESRLTDAEPVLPRPEVPSVALPAAGYGLPEIARLTDAEPAPEPVLEPLFTAIGGGIASFYGRELAGARTASGQRFDPTSYTAAHRTLPFGTQVRVTNAATGDSVVVTINDRGPFHSNRVIDLSEAAARKIGIARAGSGSVRLSVAQPNG